MGRRSNFERKPRDLYSTWDPRAVAALLPHIEGSFAEPCAGDGVLVDQLEAAGHPCTWKSDIEPQRENIVKMDAFDFNSTNHHQIISNIPWNRKIMHPMIDHFRLLCPTWLLFDAAWMHTKQSAELIQYCQKIVSVGRIRWIKDSKMDGKDDCAWFLFKKEKCLTEFIGR